MEALGSHFFFFPGVVTKAGATTLGIFIWALNSGPVLAWQALYQMSHPPSL